MANDGDENGDKCPLRDLSHGDIHDLYSQSQYSDEKLAAIEMLGGDDITAHCSIVLHSDGDVTIANGGDPSRIPDKFRDLDGSAISPLSVHTTLLATLGANIYMEYGADEGADPNKWATFLAKGVRSNISDDLENASSEILDRIQSMSPDELRDKISDGPNEKDPELFLIAAHLDEQVLLSALRDVNENIGEQAAHFLADNPDKYPDDLRDEFAQSLADRGIDVPGFEHRDSQSIDIDDPSDESDD